MKKNTAIVILIFVGFFVYFNSLFNGFVWDDEEQIVNNALVHSIGNIPRFFTGGTFNTGGIGTLTGIYYKPIMITVVSTLYSLFGNHAFFFHLFQVMVHIFNTIILLLLFNKLIKNNFRPKDDRPMVEISLFLALVFLVHPINFEAVGYIASLQEVLFMLFGMLALILTTKDSNKIFINISIYLLLLLSLLSKETGIVFFSIIFYYLLLFKKNNFTNYLIFSFVTLSFYFILRFVIAGITIQQGGIAPIMQSSLLERIINIPSIILFYLKTFLLPIDLVIAQNWLIKSINLSNFYLPLMLIFLLLFLAVFYFKTTKNKIFLFFFLWFMTSIGLHLQLFPLDMTVAERWFYLPMVGVLGMIGIIINNLLFERSREQSTITSRRASLARRIILVLIITIFSIRTIIRSFDWRNGMTLYGHDIKLLKNSYDLENNLGVELYRVNRMEEAGKHFENSVKIIQNWWINWNNLGAYYEYKKDYGKASECYLKSIKNGDYFLAYENYTGILIKQKKSKEARIFLENKALPKFPYNSRLKEMYLYLTSLKD